MPKFVQEKYQTTTGPYDDEANDHQWVWPISKVVTKKGLAGPQLNQHGESSANVFYNSLPPGMDIEDQECTDQRKFNWSTSGNDSEGKNAGDVTRDLTAKSVRSGYDRKVCCPTDDMYTREHNDAFYDDPEVDGQHGFIERNNYLDRL